MIYTPRNGIFASDMAVLGIKLPLDKIVLLSWIVSEYDGLAFVKTEKVSRSVAEGLSSYRKEGCVSIFFPEEKRNDVLELLTALSNEGMDLEIVFEAPPFDCISSCKSANDGGF